MMPNDAINAPHLLASSTFAGYIDRDPGDRPKKGHGSDLDATPQRQVGAESDAIEPELKS
jgi:hypothetical protein